jgi:RHH-type proline utilization regulon transcriptional repressor/proline dehydrogenase/delta 1-pyrroline-5-carboxylate dehydrogenase
LGVHSRIDETIDFITARAHVGNIYINRNIVGAVVGVQPFGGEGKSGTGPKAGGPLYLKRLQRGAVTPAQHARLATPALDALEVWAKGKGRERVVSLADQYAHSTALGSTIELPGPTGERNTLSFAPRGNVVCLADSADVLLNQIAAVLATGNQAVVVSKSLPADLPAAALDQIKQANNLSSIDCSFQVALVESALAPGVREQLAARDGALVAVIDTSADEAIPLWRLVAERALCVNTTAAGGNASLMTLSA